jgi:hypothetical protein
MLFPLPVERGLDLRSFLLRPLAALLTFAVSLSAAWVCTKGWHTSLLTALEYKELKVSTVNALGEGMAAWSRFHAQTVSIGGRQINYVSIGGWATMRKGSKEGCKPLIGVEWQSAKRGDRPQLWKNLRDVIVESDCDYKRLSAYAARLKDPRAMRELTADRLAEDLGFLGKFEFFAIDPPPVGTE